MRMVIFLRTGNVPHAYLRGRELNVVERRQNWSRIVSLFDELTLKLITL